MTRQRLIDADALKEQIIKQYENKTIQDNGGVIGLIDNAPTIEADSGEAVAIKITRSTDGRLLLTQADGRYFDVNEAIGIPLYTSPQKQWVELTDEQIEKIARQNGTWQLYHSLKIFDFAKAISDALKEVNHG